MLLKGAMQWEAGGDSRSQMCANTNAASICVYQQMIGTAGYQQTEIASDATIYPRGSNATMPDFYDQI